MRLKDRTAAGLVLLDLLLLLGLGIADAKVRLNSTTGGGYTGLVVALPTFTGDVRVVQELITNLQTLLTNASETLHRATHGRLFFEEVTVLVPTTDSNADETLYGVPIFPAESDETYGQADVRVSADLSELLPRTVQRGDCGQPGDFIILTAGYLMLMTNETFKRHHRDPAKAFVEQWARYRFGLFGENDPSRFYYHPDRRMFEAAHCANDVVQGWLLDSETGLLCTADRRVAVPSKHCRFFHGDFGNELITSSLLFNTKLANVTEFCDETTHNRYAPTMQNLRCHGRSAWEVMREHDDFSRNDANVGELTFSPPTFRFVNSNPNVSIAVVVDLNILTANKSLLTPVLMSLRKYITFVVLDGTSLELSFVNSTVQVFPLRQTIDGSAVRDIFLEFIDLVVTSNSSSGIFRGDVLEDELSWDRGVVILMVATENVTVDNWSRRLDGAHFAPVFLNVAPDDRLARIADDTDGEVYVLSGGRSHLHSDLDSVLLDASDRFTDAYDFIPIANGILKDKGHIPDTFLVDDLTAAHLRVVVSVVSPFIHQENTSSMQIFLPEEAVVLVSPDKIYDFSNFESVAIDSFTQSLTVAHFRLPDSRPGLWSLRRGPSYDPETTVVVFQVFAVLHGRSSVHSTRAVTTRARLDRTTVEHGGLIPRLTITLMRGDLMYTAGRRMVNVTARVYLPNKPRYFQKVLTDDGAGADVMADDGVYSVFLSNIVSDGIYRVVPFVYGGDGLSCLIGSRSDCFQRSPSPLYFEVKPFSSDSNHSASDWMPPSAVRDLSLTGVKYDVFHEKATLATLEWTSPGDNYDDGTASGYDMRYFSDWSSAQNFTTGKTVTLGMVVHGNLSNPKTAGHREVMSIRFLRLNQSSDFDSSAIFVSVRAYDAAGNVANASNVVIIPVSFGTPLSNSTSPTPPTATLPSPTAATSTTEAPWTNVTEVPTPSPPTTNETMEATTWMNVTEASSNETDLTIIIEITGTTTDVGSSVRDIGGHSHDGIVASAILLFVALVITVAVCIHMRYFSSRSKQNNFAYEEFQVGERVASRIEH